MKFLNFISPSMKTERELKNIAAKCGSFFFLIAVFYLVLSIFQIGTWSIKSSDSYLLIIENAIIGFGLIKLARPVVRIVLVLYVCLIIYLFVGGYHGKVVSIFSLLILIYADMAVFRYHSLIKNHITSGSSGLPVK